MFIKHKSVRALVFLTIILLSCMFQACLSKTHETIHDNTHERKYYEISEYLEQLSMNDSFSGVVLIALGDEVSFERAYGMADKSINQPNNINTIFNLGSASKMFTAVAVAQLAEQGKLSFFDTIDKYIHDFPDEIAEKITIEQLLTHTAGLGDIFTPEYHARADEIDDIPGFLGFITDRPLLFEPGTRHSYSNGGYIVLGAIIERVSGESYYEYIRNHITVPTGMTDTDFYKKYDEIPNLARGYTNRSRVMPPSNEGNADREDNIFSLPLIGSPAGGAYSTARDMLKFSAALMNHRLLSEEYTTLITSGKAASPMGLYGYGFEDLTENGRRTIGHSGGAPGISAIFRILPDESYTVIVLSNYDMGVRRPYEEIIKKL